MFNESKWKKIRNKFKIKEINSKDTISLFCELFVFVNSPIKYLKPNRHRTSFVLLSQPFIPPGQCTFEDLVTKSIKDCN